MGTKKSLLRNVLEVVQIVLLCVVTLILPAKMAFWLGNIAVTTSKWWVGLPCMIGCLICFAGFIFSAFMLIMMILDDVV